MDKATGLEMEQAVEPQPLLEWFAEKYKEFGATLEFVTNKSQEGSQFVKGFGGIGGILRYKVAFEDLGDLDDEDDEFYGSDEDSGASSHFPGFIGPPCSFLQTSDAVNRARTPRSAPRATRGNGRLARRWRWWWRSLRRRRMSRQLVSRYRSELHASLSLSPAKRSERPGRLCSSELYVTHRAE